MGKRRMPTTGRGGREEAAKFLQPPPLPMPKPRTFSPKMKVKLPLYLVLSATAHSDIHSWDEPYKGPSH